MTTIETSTQKEVVYWIHGDRDTPGRSAQDMGTALRYCVSLHDGLVEASSAKKDRRMQALTRFLQLRMSWLTWSVVFVSSQTSAQTAGAGGTDQVSDMFIPMISQLGFGAVVGFCVGFMVKKVSKLAAVIVGLAFVLLQVLSYYDVVTIDWAPIKGWWEQATTTDKLQGHWGEIRRVLFANVPALGGAVPGFMLGLRMG